MDKEKESLIFYIDDNGESTSSYAVIISKDNGFLTFKTDKNIISIPNHRVLKIKESRNG